MLRIVIEDADYFNDETEEFHTVKGAVLDLEHSLLSLSKWESKYQKPFLSDMEKKTPEEIFGYLQSMIMTPDVDPDVLGQCSPEMIEKIQKYINSSQSATTFGEMPTRRGPGEVITSELIYYWMVLYNIPFEVETWHLNRLFSLIRICNVKSQKPKTMSRHEIAQQNREINARRRAELGTRG